MREQNEVGNYVKQLTSLLPIMGILLFSYGCKKLPGEGGGAFIQGKALHELYAPNGDILGTEVTLEEDIYIIYGDNTFTDDDVSTDKNGMFEFKYLRKGDYTIYAFEDCNTCPDEKNAVELMLTIADNKDVVIADDLVLRKDLDYFDGSASISGRILYQGIPVPFGRMFIYYGNATNPLPFSYDDIRSDADGYFQFYQLIRGDYTIIATNNDPVITVTDTKKGTISTKGESLNLGDFNISF